MLRFALPLIALIACDAGVKAKPAGRPHTISRNKLDMQGLPIPLPLHGLAVQTYGMGGYFDLEVLDTDTHALRIIADNWDEQKGHQHLDKTLLLDAAQVKQLSDLSDHAWRETQNGDMPDVTDLRQDLFIVDKDDAFYLSNSLIGATDPRETKARPNAAELVVAIQALAQPILNPPLPVEPTTRHKHSIARDMLGDTPLPLHGIVVRTWGLSGDSMEVIDRDASTIRIVENLMGKKPSDRTRTLDGKQLAELMDLGMAAWDEEMQGVMHVVPDVREDLYVLDGDEGFYLSGLPITAAGRPAAAKVVAAVYRAAK
jgi:hypothetical protein